MKWIHGMRLGDLLEPVHMGPQTAAASPPLLHQCSSLACSPALFYRQIYGYPKSWSGGCASSAAAATTPSQHLFGLQHVCDVRDHERHAACMRCVQPHLACSIYTTRPPQHPLGLQHVRVPSQALHDLGHAVAHGGEDDDAHGLWVLGAAPACEVYTGVDGRFGRGTHALTPEGGSGGVPAFSSLARGQWWGPWFFGAGHVGSGGAPAFLVPGTWAVVGPLLSWSLARGRW